MKRLFVIGNGFDLHHKLKTGFNDFREYLENQHLEYLQFINDLIKDHNPLFDSNNWNYIEDDLTCVVDLDYYNMLEEAIASSETDMDRASYWNDIQFNAEYFNQDLVEFKNCFDLWINSIDIKSAKCDAAIKFGPQDKFLNFNYTNTLQVLYNIQDSQILYIHGKVGEEKAFGHNSYFDDPLPMSNLTQEHYDHGIEDDWRIEEAKAILNRLPRLFYKNSEALIEKHAEFFDGVSDVDEIVFMGWALGTQDELYMQSILDRIDSLTTINIVYYKDDECAIKNNYQKHINSYPQKPFNVFYYTWEEASQIFQ